MTDLKAKKAAIQQSFQKLDAERKQVEDTRNQANRKLNEIAEQIVRLDAQFRLLEELEKDGNGKDPKPTTVSPKNEKEKKAN